MTAAKKDATPIDSNSTSSDVTRGTNTRGEAKPEQEFIRLVLSETKPEGPYGSILSIIEPAEQARRDNLFEAMAQNAKGRRGQPPMIDRLYEVMIHVDDLERRGMRSATARDSRMNKTVRKRLNKDTRGTTDPRKSRRKQIGADTVKVLLKKVRKLRNGASD